jgi:hypothetical protein
MLDIKGNSSNPLVARLSNFTARPFVFDGVPCAGLEGFLQSVKCQDVLIQKEICAMKGRDAKQQGTEYDTWKDSQILWWNGKPYSRSSREYLLLVTKAYDAVFKQDKSFAEDLRNSGHEEICHSIGNPDMRDTVLTEVEMLYQLNRLRIRVLSSEGV